MEEVIDIKPTWTQLCPLFFDWIKRGTPEQSKIAKEHILKMAEAIDKHNKVV